MSLIRLGMCSMVFVAGTFTLSAAELYANRKDPLADDKNSGTREESMKTISAATQIAKPGDTVMVVPGIYRESPSLTNSCPATDQRGRLRPLPGSGFSFAIGAFDTKGTFPLHTVTFTAGTGGTISGTSPQTVAEGGSTSPVTPVPNTGYHFDNWTGDHAGTENPLTITNVTKDMTVTANVATQSPAYPLAALPPATLATPALAVINIEYVTVGNAGNAADTMVMDDSTTGYGSVAYVYRISKYETTISQYAAFLNAVAKTDTYGLYNDNMTSGYINGISQGGVSGGFTYSVNPGSGNKPITFVSWLDAARFCNWIQNGQPTGLQTATTTETGAYTLNGATSGIILKNVGAKVWIPSEIEWYKAAYYDPNKGGAGVGGYWSHANQSNTMTTNDIGVAGAANYIDANGYAVWTGSGAGMCGITDVGAYGLNSVSAYGTYDQAGNVWELNDSVMSGMYGPTRGIRGGAWNSKGNALGPKGNTLASSCRYCSVGPANEFSYVGFRVASVP